MGLCWFELDSGMLDHVNVASHGVQTPLSHVAAVSVSSLETLTVMPYDASVRPRFHNAFVKIKVSFF